MFPVFKKYVSDKIMLTNEDWLLIEKVSIIKKLRKHQYLLQEGDVWWYNAFDEKSPPNQENPLILKIMVQTKTPLLRIVNNKPNNA